MILICCAFGSTAQNIPQKIYDTEKAFEKAVTEKGINQGFIEFLAPVSVMFSPNAIDGRELWRSRSVSPAALTWNPIWIDVSANGAMAYSIGNSIYQPKGPSDKDRFYGHYLSVWSRQPNGEYLASLDIGISHEKPSATPTEWKSPAAADQTTVKGSAGDSATLYYEMVEQQGATKAYKAYLADDVFLLREGSQPFIGKKAALGFIENRKTGLKFAKRKSFIEAVDLAYVHSTYSTADKTGKEIEKGNFVQVWKLRNGKWQIVADLLLPVK